MGSRIFRFSLIKFSSTFWTEGTVDRSFNLLSSWICSSLVSIWLYMRVKKEGTQTKKTKTISLTLYMYYKNRGYGIFFFGFILIVVVFICIFLWSRILLSKIVAPLETHFIGLNIPFYFLQYIIYHDHINIMQSWISYVLDMRVSFVSEKLTYPWGITGKQCNAVQDPLCDKMMKCVYIMKHVSFEDIIKIFDDILYHFFFFFYYALWANFLY